MKTIQGASRTDALSGAIFPAWPALAAAALVLFCLALPAGSGPAEAQQSPGLQTRPFAPPADAMNVPGPGNQNDQQGQNAGQPPESQAEMLRRLKNEAFHASLEALMPMSPAQIREFLRRMDITEQETFPHGAEPEGDVRVETISLDPGVSPPEVFLAQGFMTTIAMYDATGEPWPIVDIGVGGPFDVLQSDSNQGGHMLRINPTQRYGRGNASIQLQGLPTAVTLRLTVGTDMVDYRYDARVPEFGPNASPPLMDRGISLVAGDQVLLSILEGVPPGGASPMRVVGVDGRTQAWSMANQTFLRTPHTLLSPGWEGSVSSADGMNVYVLADAPVVLLSDGGAMLRARLSDIESDIPRLTPAAEFPQ